ncbi:MAG: hypothetical protein MJK18_12760, partial [Bdellovibrionales bacterium]|nr:hypothetical protein [Bdellovibrionales bacterium]
QYKSDGQLEVITASANQAITFSYSGDKVSSISAPNGQTNFSYNGDDLETVTFADGTSQSYNYLDGMMIEERNRRDIPTTFEYNQYNRLSKIVRANDSEIVFKSHLDGTFNDPNNDITALKEFYELNNSISQGGKTKLSYQRDLNGDVRYVSNSDGLTTIIERNKFGLPVRVTRPDGSEREIEYFADTLDVKTTVDSLSGEEMIFSYNEYGQVLTESRNGRIKVRSYTDKGLLRAETLPNSSSSFFTYYDNGLIKSVEQTIDQSSSMSRDFEYDSSGNLIRTYDSFGKSTEITRDIAGNILSRTSKVSASQFSIEEFSYDNFNRITSVTSPNNETTQYEYSPTGQLERVIDPTGEETIFSYDILDRNISIKTPLDQETKFKYDDNDNLIEKINAKNQSLKYRYDDDNKLVLKILPDDTYRYEYDSGRRVSLIENSVSTVTLNYDDLGRLISSVTSGEGELSNYPTIRNDYSYNSDSNRESFTDNYGTDLRYGYDQNGIVSQIQDSNRFTYSYSFDHLGRVKSVSMPGMLAEYSHNNKIGITSIDYSSGGSVKAFFNYVRNDLEQVKGSSCENKVVSYDYDLNEFITNATRTYSDGRDLASLDNETFSYDEIGNRTSDSQGSYSYDNTKQILQESWKYRFSYDANGNLIGKTDKITDEHVKYEYSSENQLMRVRFYENILSTNAKKSVDYYYDGLGRRMKKVVVDNDNLSDKRKTYTRQYAYDQDEMYLEFDEESNLLARYVHSNLRTDDTLAVEVTTDGVDAQLAPSTGTFTFLKDSIGSITHIANESGEVVQKHEYSSFGDIIRIFDSTGSVVTASAPFSLSFMFANRELDRETNFYYNRARYYAQEIGRFLQRVPDPGKIKLPLTLINKYIYGGNNPLVNIDPSGQSFIRDLIVGALVVVAAVFTGGYAGAAVGGAVGGGTAGAVAGAVAGAIAGAVAGGLVGGLANGIFSAIEGDSFGDGFKTGARVGALIGGIVGGLAGGFAGYYAKIPGSDLLAGGGDEQAKGLSLQFKLDDATVRCVVRAIAVAAIPIAVASYSGLLLTPVGLVLVGTGLYLGYNVGSGCFN